MAVVTINACTRSNNPVACACSRALSATQKEENKMNPELEAVKIINRLMPSLTYLELSVLESAISTRRYKLRQVESEKFKVLEEV